MLLSDSVCQKKYLSKESLNRPLVLFFLFCVLFLEIVSTRKILQNMKIAGFHPHEGASHGQPHGGGQIAQKRASPVPVRIILGSLLELSGAPPDIVHRAPPTLLHLGAELVTGSPLFVAEKVTLRVGRHMALVDQLAALRAWWFGCHIILSISVALGTGIPVTTAFLGDFVAPSRLHLAAGTLNESTRS